MKPQYIEVNAHGNKFYYLDRHLTILHREDGPAVEYADGTKGWILNDEELTAGQHANLMYHFHAQRNSTIK